MKWQRYTTKTNEADARRVMTRKAADGRRYKLTDENDNLLDLIGQGLPKHAFDLISLQTFPDTEQIFQWFSKNFQKYF